MRSFLKLTALSLQGKMYYRTSFLMNLLTPVILLLGQYMLWGFLYSQQGQGEIGGMRQADMFSYILVAFALNNLLTWSTENTLSREIRKGTVVSRCVRPVAFLTQSLAEMTGSLLAQGVVNFAVVLIGFVAFSTNLTVPTLFSVILFIPCFLFGTLLRMMMTEVASLLCFFTTSHLGISWTRRALFEFFSGAMIPVTMFPELLRSIAYLTPFPYMVQIVISVLLGQELPVSYSMVLILQVVWIGIFFMLHCLLFGRVRKNLTIAGG